MSTLRTLSLLVTPFTQRSSLICAAVISHFSFCVSMQETKMVNKTEGLVQDVSRDELRIALGKMSSGKANGPSELSAELLKALGEYGIDWLHDTMKDVWNTGNIPDGWRNGTDIQRNSNNYPRIARCTEGPLPNFW